MKHRLITLTMPLAIVFSLVAIAFTGAIDDTNGIIEKDGDSNLIDPYVSISEIESSDFQAVKAHRLSKFWKDTETQPEYLQADCGTCHRTLKVSGAPLLTLGRTLIRERGCVGCHELGDVFKPLDRGPNLDDLGNKTDRAWLYNWLKDPSIYLPKPGMPSFRLDEDEILYLVEFLMSLDSKNSPPRPVAGDPLEVGDPDKGNVLVRESRCITCHSIHERGGHFAPELELVGDKVRPEWLANFLRNVHYYQPEKKMLAYNFSEQDALDIAAFILEEYSEEEFEFLDEDSLTVIIPDSVSLADKISKGKELFLFSGCRGCHDVKDMPKYKVAPDLSRIAERHKEDISFGKVEDAAKNLANWIFMKVSDPDAFSEMLNMPDFSFSSKEALAITVALLSNKNVDYSEEWMVRRVEPKVYASPDEEFAGLLDRYSCLSCHRIEGFGGDISTAPLTFEGSKVKYDWLKDYLIRPHAVRPTLTERMPHFRMTENEAATMANYIKSVYVTDDIPYMSDYVFSQKEVSRGKAIFEQKQCVSCHIINKSGGYVGPQLDNIAARLEPGWIYAWMRTPLKLRPGSAQPDYRFNDEDAKALTAYLMAHKVKSDKDETE